MRSAVLCLAQCQLNLFLHTVLHQLTKRHHRHPSKRFLAAHYSFPMTQIPLL